MSRNLCLLMTLCLGTMTGSYAAPPVTTGALINQMTDMHRLIEMPDPPYRNVQFSSYDHRSNHPGGQDWFQNSDGFGSEPIPNFEAVLKEPDGDGIGEYLICDIEGPGAIERTWSARILGNIQMYLDNSETPIYDGTAETFFMRTYEPYLAETGLDAEVLAGAFYQRDAAYCPIPFAERCRIVWIGNLKSTHFYHIQLRQYAPGTTVQTFTPADLKTYGDQIRKAAELLRNPDQDWTPTDTFSSSMEPGKREVVWNAKESGVIEHLRLKLEASDRDLALRQTILHIQFDGYPWGQVQSPVGDFFGAAPGVAPYQSLPFTVEPDGSMTCRFPMPYENTVRISLENMGEQTVSAEGAVQTAAYDWNPDRSMHFRARWRINHGLLGTGAAPQDIPYLIAHGTGNYVGSTAYLLNPAAAPTPGGNWWGEGDEKIFVDDDWMPSFFGTGSEDYFNYSWSAEDIFYYPYCGQPVNDGPGNRGFVTNFRWHILDPIPFQQRISFYMELYAHTRTPDMAYARIGYHYARPGTMDDHVVINPDMVRPQALPMGWQPAPIGAAMNSEFYEPKDLLAEIPANSMRVEGPLWSNGELLRWQPRQPGEELTFIIPIKEPGSHNFRLGMALDSDSGKISARIQSGDEDPGEGKMLDLYDPHRTLLRGLDVAAKRIDGDKVKMILRFEGGKPDIGIDFIWVQRRRQ